MKEAEPEAMMHEWSDEPHPIAVPVGGDAQTDGTVPGLEQPC